MKKLLTYVIVTVALLAAGQAFASEVTSVELNCSQGSTVASINVEGAVRFTHQTEEAKDGKPFRVIVDILSATHKLGANNFMSLPDSPIKAIRSSQYSVKPEAVVRIVFDMEAEQVYRVDSDNKKITLNFADKSKRQFASWSTAPAVSARKAASPAKVKKAKEVKVASAPAKPKQKSAVELNKSIKTDRMASLEPKAATAPAPTKTKKVVKKTASSTPKLSQSDTHYGPYVDATLLEEKKAAAKSTKPQVKAKPVVAKALTEPAKTTSVPAAKAPAKSKAVTAPVKSKTTAKKPAVKQTPPAKKSAPVVAKAKPKAEKKSQVVAKVEKDATKSKKSTSRFRRSPVTSKKIAGTLVAEFPKRLVIKYKARNHRDPFATLIDESKQNNDPVERRAPNVEGLKLVGVIETGAKDNRALFEDNEGTGYILRSGDKVRKGYVLRVESDRVYFQIFEYGWSRTVALHLES